MLNELEPNLGRGLRRFFIWEMSVLQIIQSVSNLIAERASGDAMSNQECNRGTKSVVGTGIFCNQIHCFLALLDLNDVYQGQRTISTARNILTSFFFRFLIGSGVSSSGDAAVPEARFLTLIPILFERKGEDLKWTNVRVL